MKLNTHLHLVLRLRTSGAIPPFPLHTFTTWTGKPDLQFYLSPLCAYTIMLQTYRHTFTPRLIYLELIEIFRDISYKQYATRLFVFLNFPSPQTTSVVTQITVVRATLNLPTAVPSSDV